MQIYNIFGSNKKKCQICYVAEVAVDGHHGAGLDGVEHALEVVLRAVAEVEVAAQCARCARWDRQRTGWGCFL